MPVSETAEFGLEVLLFAKLFHDPAISFGSDRHFRLPERWRDSPNHLCRQHDKCQVLRQTDRRASASKKYFFSAGDSCGIRGRDDPSRALEADVAIRRGKGGHSALDGVDDSGQMLDTDLAHQPGDRSYLS